MIFIQGCEGSNPKHDFKYEEKVVIHLTIFLEKKTRYNHQEDTQNVSFKAKSPKLFSAMSDSAWHPKTWRT